jgi:hypothetical protein
MLNKKNFLKLYFKQAFVKNLNFKQISKHLSKILALVIIIAILNHSEKIFYR